MSRACSPAIEVVRGEAEAASHSAYAAIVTAVAASTRLAAAQMEVAVRPTAAAQQHELSWGAAAAASRAAATEHIVTAARAAAKVVSATDAAYRAAVAKAGLNGEPDAAYAVTLVTQLTPDRLHLLRRIAQHWAGPVSACVYMLDTFNRAHGGDWDEDEIRAKWRATFPRVMLSFLPDTHLPHYPVNTLRNCALRPVTSGFTLILDVDFLPSEGAYEQIATLLRAIFPVPSPARLWNASRVVEPFLQNAVAAPWQQEGPHPTLPAWVSAGLRRALVLPAFEFRVGATEAGVLRPDAPPMTKRAVAAECMRGYMGQFQGIRFKWGHAPEQQSYWVSARAPYAVPFEQHWEPYVVMRSPVPLFDERFVGYGQNKISYYFEVIRMLVCSLVCGVARLLACWLGEESGDADTADAAFRAGVCSPRSACTGRLRVYYSSISLRSAYGRGGHTGTPGH